jgi:APA family basic amino acid/polyamine antiporter
MHQPTQLQRRLGLFGAVMMGLGSILGTGVFVSIGIAAGIAGPAVVLAVMIGAAVAIFNGLSSAQLAANHPVSGGTYEYGYRYLTPWLGFTAGWMFLLAKSASAATAALGFAGYLLNAFGVHGNRIALVGVALLAVFALTAIVVTGIHRSNQTNIVIVSITLATLLFFVSTGFTRIEPANFTPFFAGTADAGAPLPALLYASALMFVAYTGYGRIATLGEEVVAPRVTIPRAIITTMILTMALYVGVAVVGVGAAGADAMYAATLSAAAPLEVVARGFGITGAGAILAIGAMTAMLGVLLNLILGLSRVLLAMGRRGDMPAATGRLNEAGATPTVAVVVMGAVVAGLTLIGNVQVTWSFSAFTVLIYYALTNLAALRLSDEERFYPRILAWLGLGACLFLAFWVETAIWMIGIALIGVGLAWHWLRRR